MAAGPPFCLERGTFLFGMSVPLLCRVSSQFPQIHG